MGPSKGTIKREYTHLIENWEVPQYDSRLMRRLKRRSTASEMMEHNCRANAKRKNVGTWGDEVVKNGENSGHVLEEEVDEDYEFFLDKAVFHVSDADVNTSHDSYNDDDTDAQYKMFLENLRETDNSYILKVFAGNQLFCAKYEGQEERLHDSVNSKIHCEGDDEDYQLFLNSSRIEGDNLIYIPESAITISYGAGESEEKNSEVRQNFQVPFEVTELPNSRQVSDDYHVAKKNTHSEVRSDAVDEDWQTYLNSEIRKNSKEKCSAVRKNLQVSDAATEPPNIRQGSDVYRVAKDKRNNEVLRDVDEDWQEFLKFEVRQNLQVSSEAAEPPNAGQASDDYQMAKNKCHSEVLSDVMDEDWQIYLNSEVKKNSEEQGSAVWQNSQVSNEATELPNARQGLFASHVAKHRCNSKELGNIVDENYQLFLKSICANGDNLIYMPENGVRVVYEDECDQSSTDSEPIILDPSQYYLDSPSICQKSCHSSVSVFFLGSDSCNIHNM
ncbi:uncharacterized protein LOC114737828 [Neltuma alba]|uniref:uncharacterized protein LOC114737828 n=1 Tax=Neltuma alba TaxID=207710 RepID=UPI0010A3506D|nr:uncharacterized protein LOC114737828 [Prosopis alba]